MRDKLQDILEHTTCAWCVLRTCSCIAYDSSSFGAGVSYVASAESLRLAAEKCFKDALNSLFMKGVKHVKCVARSRGHRGPWWSVGGVGCACVGIFCV